MRASDVLEVEVSGIGTLSNVTRSRIKAKAVADRGAAIPPA